jgi:multidrug transporter EmrE-like cation transporter
MQPSPILIVLVSQTLFTASDVLARVNLKNEDGFTLAALWAPWFFVYVAVRQVAVVGQLYVLATTELGRTAGLFSATALITANLIGVLFLNDTLNTVGYVGLVFALLAITLMTIAS